TQTDKLDAKLDEFNEAIRDALRKATEAAHAELDNSCVLARKLVVVRELAESLLAAGSEGRDLLRLLTKARQAVSGALDAFARARAQIAILPSGSGVLDGFEMEAKDHLSWLDDLIRRLEKPPPEIPAELLAE